MNAPTNRSKLRLAGLGAVLLAALCTIGLGLFDGGDANRPGSAEAERHGAPTRLVCETGQRGVYSLRSSSTVATGDSGESQTAQELIATMELLVLSRNAAHADVGIRLHDVVVRAGEARDTVAEQAFGAPFVMRLDLGTDARQSVVVELRYPSGIADAAKRRLDGLARSFQFALPHPSPLELHVHEDSLGRYRARFERTDAVAAGTVSVQRQKLAYLKDSTNEVPRTVQLLASAATFHATDTGPWLESATIDEDLEVHSIGALAARIRQQMSLQLRESSRGIPVSAADWLAGDEGGASARAVAAGIVLEKRAAAAMAPLPTRAATAADQQALTELMARYVDSEGVDMAALHALARLLAEVPELASEVERTLRRPDLLERAASGLCHALELASAPQCQQSLLAIGSDPELRSNLRFAAISALGGVKQPTVDAESALRELVAADDKRLATAAELALGNMGNALRQAEPSRYVALRELLADRVTAAVTADAAATAMRAAGNTRDPSLAPVALSRLHDHNAPTRAAAAETAGKLGGPTVAPELSSALRSEPDARVRGALVRGLVAAGDINAMCAVCADLVGSEADNDARGAMARVLADHVSDRPELRPVLHRMLQNEPSARTAAYVAGRLYRNPR